MSQKTWGGRFTGRTDDRVEAFTESISYDQRLFRHDIRASQAHARMLAEAGLLSADEASRITAALDDIRGQINCYMNGSEATVAWSHYATSIVIVATGTSLPTIHEWWTNVAKPDEAV